MSPAKYVIAALISVWVSPPVDTLFFSAQPGVHKARGDVCGRLPLVLCRRIARVMTLLSGIPRRLVCPKSGTEGREIRRTERASLRLRRRNFDVTVFALILILI